MTTQLPNGYEAVKVPEGDPFAALLVAAVTGIYSLLASLHLDPHTTIILKKENV